MIKRFFLSVILYLLMAGFAFAGSILNSPMFQAFDDNGDPLTGGLLYSYIAGTTTAKALYTDKACTTPDTNPVVLDSRGEAEIYGTTGGYKLILKTAADVTIWTIDNIDIATNFESYHYFPDSSEADQGAATGGGNLTVKDFVDSIGGTKQATIIFTHTGTANTTTYTFLSNETITSNIFLEVQNGAFLSIDTGITLTVGAPENIEAKSKRQIFTGSGDVAFTNGGLVPVGWYADIHKAIDGISSTVATLWMSEPATLTKADEVVSTTTLFWDGAGNAITGAYTLTLTGCPIQAGNYKILDTGVTIAGTPDVEKVSVKWTGTTGDGSTDDGPLIQDADDIAALNQNIVYFPPGDYLFTTAVTKDAYTTWEGAMGSQTPQTGVNLVNGQTASMIVMSETGTVNTGNSGFKNLRMVNNLSTYAAAKGVDYTTVVRRQVFEDCYIYGFKYGVYGFIFEHYYSRVFWSGGNYGIYATVGVDSWFDNCHGGSGIGATGVTSGAGFYFLNSNNLQFKHCRFQVQEGGQGGFFKNSSNLNFVGPVVDQNESHGMQFQNCQNVLISNGNVFDNGTTAVQRKGLSFQTTTNLTFDDGDVNTGTDTITITSHGIQNTAVVVQFSNSGGALPTGISADTDYNIIRVDANNIKLALGKDDADDGTAVDITAAAGGGTHSLLHVADKLTISNTNSMDRNFGTANEVQQTGIHFIHGSATSIIRDITLVNNDLINNDTAIENISNIDSGAIILNNRGHNTPVQTLSGAGAVDIISDITHVVTTGVNALTLADGHEGQRKYIVMKTDGGDGTLTPSNLGNGSTITFDDVGDCADLIFTNGAWYMIGGTATLA